MKIIFMGTPDFSVGTLEALVEAGHEVVLAVTQPDKPKGRGKEMQFTPVKECALAHNIPVYQPKKIREPECIEELKKYQADVCVVVAFGQILPKEILEMTPYGCINVHASLLPKYRGAAPIQWAVINGEKVSGVTTMQMDEGLDTGDMLEKVEITLDKKETGGSLFDKLAITGGSLILETLEKLENNTAVTTPQDDDKSTYAGKITKELGHIDFTKSAEEIERLIRGLNPWPSAFTYLDEKVLKIWDADVIDEEVAEEPGTIISTNKTLKVATADGYLDIKELQLQGKKRMDVVSFLNGYKINSTKLG